MGEEKKLIIIKKYLWFSDCLVEDEESVDVKKKILLINKESKNYDL
ncbi:hypothetical protein SAMN02745163_01102 [Clostridium cavendishii DSM 21758]|uniref:Uncharacterized protein n=2 Tax=Clostridium TaxID=1485 RepID=A0A1M6FCQ8_9CLOT|nr:hypothetical protein SAMN02745163_01102 [Clostridium cavendishii DSM 21758]